MISLRCCAGVAFVLLAVTSKADELTVEQIKGEEKGSLAWAVKSASGKLGKQHKIVFSPKTDGKEIIIDKPLKLIGDVEVKGNGIDKTIIGGGGKSSLFQVESDKSKVIFSQMTLQNSKSESPMQRGSVIDAKGSNVIQLEHLKITKNAGGVGGCVYIDDGQFNAQNVEWLNNETSALKIFKAKGDIKNSRFVGHQEGAVLVAEGQLVVEDSVFEDNKSFSGGALSLVKSTAQLYRVTMKGNSVEQLKPQPGMRLAPFSGNGGAINVDFLAELELHEVTLSGNKAEIVGGAINFTGERLVVSNSTISGNEAPQAAAISLRGKEVKIDASTIAFNKIDPGLRAALWAKGQQAKISITNSIVARTEDKEGKPGWDIGSESGDSFVVLSSIIEKPGQSAPEASTDRHQIQGNPYLAPLADNGGPTWTHALMEKSPAINAGKEKTDLKFDQRHLPRIVGKAMDIGSYEQQNDNAK